MTLDEVLALHNPPSKKEYALNYNDFKELVKKIKLRYPEIKLALLTNSTRFTDKNVFDACLMFSYFLLRVNY